MRRFLFALASVLIHLFVVVPVQAERVTLEEAFKFPPGGDALCDGGLTAIQRLPPVRIVVFDPISNSFAFIACDPDGQGDARTISNQDLLDRHRLALTTQKIRLLILPYNPSDGDLTLITGDGNGVEFNDLVAGLPPAENTTDTETEDQPVPEDTPEMPAITNERVRRERDDRAEQMGGQPGRLPKDGESTYSNLADLDLRWKEYSPLAEETSEGLHLLRRHARCIGGNLATAPSRLTHELSLDSKDSKGSEALFSLERDVLLDEVRKEAERRLRLIGRDFYDSCLLDPQALSFQGDISAFEALTAQLAVNIDRLRRQTEEMTRVIRRLPLSKPAAATPEEWRMYLDSLRVFMNEMDDFNASLVAGLEESLASAQQFRSEHNRFLGTRSSPAMHIQRFDYSPLAEGKSITFTIRRGEEREGDGPRVPQRVNKLEIKSAPVYTMRFSMGLVASRLKDPTFSTIPIPEEESAAGEEEEEEEPTTMQILRFDDEANGKALAGLFLHHYWGRRSPLLEPTPFERWMPTLSVGIPVTQADPLTQFFLGLNWELIPGFEAHVGYHFGKVNSLVRDPRIQIGAPLPAGVETTAVQKKKFDSAVYFGIAVNREAFTRAFGNGGNGGS